jgi:hypothetical protein
MTMLFRSRLGGVCSRLIHSSGGRYHRNSNNNNNNKNIFTSANMMGQQHQQKKKNALQVLSARFISSSGLTIELKTDKSNFENQPKKEDLVFGTTLSDHMLTIEWDKQNGWRYV